MYTYAGHNEVYLFFQTNNVYKYNKMYKYNESIYKPYKTVVYISSSKRSYLFFQTNKVYKYNESTHKRYDTIAYVSSSK